MSMFRIQAFAKLAGVTVRTLHHYDRLGLLSPAGRSDAGYRLYTHDDLGHLERILVLRYLGLSLHDIAELLKASKAQPVESLLETLGRQRAVLRARRDGLDSVLAAIDRVEKRAAANTEPEWLLYQTILKEIHMQQTLSWTDKYYTEAGLEAIRERRATWTPELQKEADATWEALYAELERLMQNGVPPESDEARSLAARWMKQAQAFTAGNRELEAGLQKLYADSANWPEGNEYADRLRKYVVEPEQRAYVDAAMRASILKG